MSYKCRDCGSVFDLNEAKEIIERHGLDTPPYEHISVCPNCESEDFDEMVSCSKCGAEALIDETIEGLCPECVENIVDNYKNDVLKCYCLCADDDEPVEINWFLSRMFAPAQINQILLRELLSQQKTTPVDCMPYINYDLSAFIETVIWEEKHEHKKED